MTTLLLLTTADTELLALRVVAELLPPGLHVRGANPVDRAPGPTIRPHRDGTGREGADLAGADLAGADLAGADLAGADLAGADLAGADLAGMDIAGMDIAGMDIAGIDLAGVDIVVLRLLGGRAAWPEGFDALAAAARQRALPLLALGGERELDPECATASTVPEELLARALSYLVEGGPENLAQLCRLLADELTGSHFGSEPPRPIPEVGVLTGRSAEPGEPGRPRVGVVFYRAHLVAGNTGFVEDLGRAITRAGGEPVLVWCYSLRVPAAIELLASLHLDAVVTTVWAAGSLGPDGETWDPGALGRLGVPILQAVGATSPAAEWEESPLGLRPLDVAMSVALPELDGRIDGPVVSTKEIVDDGDDLGTPVSAYRSQPDRVTRAATLAVRLAGLRHRPVGDRKVALVLSAYPTRRSRLGNAVGLDTPASVLRLLDALERAGYRVGPRPESGDRLMAELADGLTYDRPSLGPAERARALGRVSAAWYRERFDRLPAALRDAMADQWGPPPGRVGCDDGTLFFAGLRFGNVLVAVQPPRGFGEDPIAVYHSPDLPPTHHYLAFYRWLDEVERVDTIVHVGKHGTLEWLPGKSVGLSAACAPDAVLGSVPLVYPFVVNDPGEGTQAKRRAHAVIVDHLVPPLTRAETYDDLARLEGLLDTHAQLAALDPTKLPAIRRQVWEVLVGAELHRDLGVDETPDFDDPSFDDLVLRLDGYLCELKDAQIRGGLHVLGAPPAGEALIDMVLALTRLPQGRIPSLREAVASERGIDLERAGRRELDALEAACRARVAELAAADWRLPDAAGEPDGGAEPADGAHSSDPAGRAGDRSDSPDGANRDATAKDVPGEQIPGEQIPDENRTTTGLTEPALGTREDGPSLSASPAGHAPRGAPATSPSRRVLTWVAETLVPALRATTGELDAVLSALDGRHVEPGPSGAPSRSGAHVLPTGRNFYSLDPRAVPTPLAYDVGWRMATQLCARHREETGRFPERVGLVVWGTAAMRTGGDDLATALALLGVRPRWSPASGRVEGVEVIDLAELGRPRVDVTLRISGLFRDAFPNLVTLFEEACRLVAEQEEPPAENPLRGQGELSRVFGPKPGAYGSGILAVLESGRWQGDADLAEVYLTWGGWSYSGRAWGAADRDGFADRLRGLDVAAKLQDNREHDIFDSDDYLQDHGGMVAAARALAGRAPRAYFGDSADPSRPRVRALAEEAARVVRSRVLNPRWLAAMRAHGYKGAFELAATVDYLFGYDATAGIVEDWMYERVTEAYLADPEMKEFFRRSNPHAYRAIAERLEEAAERGLWEASAAARATLRRAILEGEGFEEERAETRLEDR